MNKRIAIVSGANGNLGKAVVQHLLSKHWQVNGLVHHFSGREEEGYTESEVDLLNEDATKQVLDKISSNGENIEVAVLTVGGFSMGSIEKTSMKELKHQYNLNFITAYNIARPLLIQMKKQGEGKLFFISSMPGVDTKKGKDITAYSLAKSQLTQLAHIINAETKGTNVKAYVIVPTTIDTPENRKAMPDADYNKWESPEDIAKIIGHYIHQEIIDSTEIIVQEELKKNH